MSLAQTSNRMVHCYNKGCNKLFDPDTNSAGLVWPGVDLIRVLRLICWILFFEMLANFTQACRSFTTPSKAGPAATKSQLISPNSWTYQGALNHGIRMKNPQSRRNHPKMILPMLFTFTKRPSRLRPQFDPKRMTIWSNCPDMFNRVWSIFWPSRRPSPKMESTTISQVAPKLDYN